MTKKNFHSARSEKKILAYGTAQGIGAFRPKPRPLHSGRARYFKLCPYCGAHLDPGERCSCRTNEKEN